MYFSFPHDATRPVYFILLDFTVLIIFSGEYKLRSALLCNSFHHPVTSSMLGPNILLNIVLTHPESVFIS